MSTLPLAPADSPQTASLAERSRGTRMTVSALAVALLAIVLYAAFDHGAAANDADTRVQVALAVAACLAGAVGLWSGALRFAAPRIALGGVALLAAFAAWSGVTVLWSVAPDETWLELNRAIAYMVMLCLAVMLGASDRRAARWAGEGFLAVALIVTLYALGQKLVPGLHVAGVFNLNQTGPLPRLQEPLGYWNALALFIALAVPVSLAVVVDRASRDRRRLGALAALVLMLLTIGLTYSRGAMIAVVLAVGLGIALSGSSLRTLMWLAVACIALVPPLVFGLSDHALTTAGVSLRSRESAGLILFAILLASLGAVLAGSRKLLEVERRASLRPRQIQLVKTGLGGIAVIAVVGLVSAVALSSRGLDGTVSHAWKSFTATRAASVSRPSRLLSVDSENRWVWWKEAAGAFSDRPLAGWGAGSFPVVHLLYRRDGLTVNQPHSVPLQFLAETGVVGAVLAMGSFALLIAGALRLVRRTPSGSQRLLFSALFAGASAYVIHALYDWDWDIPAVTMPALLFLGVLAGSGRRGLVQALPRRRVSSPGVGVRLVAISALTLALCSFVLSVVLPSLAASKASSALVEAASSSPGAVKRALASAKLAGSLDPLSDAGSRVEATIAARAQDWDAAVSSLLDAVRREPTDAQAWRQLAFVELGRGDRADALRAAKRVLELDPRGQSAATIAGNLGEAKTLVRTPPSGSATAQP